MPTASGSSPVAAASFDWPLAFEAESLLRRHIEAFLAANSAARSLAARMARETGTDFFEWVDHFTVDEAEAEALRAVGLIEEHVPAPAGWRVFAHPRAMLPRVVLCAGGSANGAPAVLAIRPESIVDFCARNQLGSAIEGGPGARLRRAHVSEENGHRFLAVERLACRGFVVDPPDRDFVGAVVEVREAWHARRRDFPDDAAGAEHVFALQERAFGLVGRDVAADLFFAGERAFWETRNAAARLQKDRQDVLGLGWGNHDHHTFRCSRPHFADLARLLVAFGFEKRERYYAGAEAGWGAQISEHRATGVTVFADVDLMPDEIAIDFSSEPLGPAPRLGTVGLWCALHGDSLLQAGMHHLEARFDFAALREQLAALGVSTMRPFSDFPFLKQAFTDGERWTVDPGRVSRLREQGLITDAQADGFLRDGAIGSHLENLQRRGGYKGFNQKSVSVIIAATDPRAMQQQQQQQQQSPL
jgi:hypothetical protein